MLPALVDFKTSTTTSQMQAKRSSLQNPNAHPNSKGQITSSSPIFSDSTGFSPIDLASSEQQPQRSSVINSSHLEREASTIPIANEGNFASPSMSRLGSEKPMVGPPSGLAKPRLVKVRKHFVSHQGRSTHFSESQVDSGFNPFRPVSESSDGSRMQFLRDQCRNWNPFASDYAEKSKGSTGSDTSVRADFEFGKSENGGFVFGANGGGSASNSNSKPSGFSESEGKSHPDEIKKLNIGSGMEFQSTKDASFSTGEKVNSKSSEVSEKDAFVLGSSISRRSSVSNSNSKTSGFSESAGKLLPDGTKKFNIGSGREFQSGKDGSFSNGEKVNLKSSEVSQKGVFLFGSSSKKSSRLDGSTVSKLPDEMGKSNIESSGDGDTVEKTKESNSSFEANDTDTFIFKSWNSVASSFGRNTVSKLPNEVKKLDIEDSGNIASVGNTKDSSFNYEASDKSTFVFGSSKDTAAFTCQSSASKMPNEMRNLNVEGIGNGGVEKTKGSNFQINKDRSIFGSSKNMASSFGGSTVNMLPDEMKILNIGSKIGENGGGCPYGGFASFKIYVKDKQNGNSMGKIFHDPAAGDSIHTPLAFQARTQAKSLGVDPVLPFQPTDHSEPNDASVSTSAFSSAGPGFHSVGNAFEVPCMNKAEMKADFSFTSTHGLGKLHTDFRTPSTGNLFAGLNQKLEFSAKRGVKNTRLKKGRGKWRRSAPVHKNSLSRKNSSQENSESSGCYSPMDCSPYHETLAADQCSRETSVASDEPFHLDANCVSTDAHPSVFMNATYEDLVTVTRSSNISENDPKYRELRKEGSGYQFEKGVGAKCPLKEFVSGSGTETECLSSKTEKVDTNSDTNIAATETVAGFFSNIEKQASDCRTCFGSNSEDFSDINFTFAASSSSQGHLSAPKRHYRKKNQMKVAQGSHRTTSDAKIQLASSTVQVFPLTSDSSLWGPGQVKKSDSSTSQSKGMSRSDGDKKLQGSISSAAATAATAATREACEKWRLRGNQAYANGNLSKAEYYYTCGVNCVSPNETSKSCIRALVLCYSNRAATWMSLGRMREALKDCKMAGAIDPNFLKVQVRAANCHLALGEIEDALKYFKKCLESGGDDVCSDQKIVIEASEGLKKAQKVAEYANHCAELLQRRTSNDAKSALRVIAEAISISPYSEKFVEMKAEILLMLRKYEEVVQLCEQSLDSAHKSPASINADDPLEILVGSEIIKNSPTKLWCWYLISKAYFYLGRLEDALDFLEKLEQLEPVTENCGSKTLKSFISFADTVRDLLRHKAAGNKAFQSGRHSEAVEHYTAALSCSVGSHPFAAICFCNRAAAHQALGQITDAIADCSLAIALEKNYPKAISRRATLHEMIRDYKKAASDLQRLFSLIKKQTEDKTNQCRILGSSTSIVNDLRQARLRLSTLEEEARKEIPLNMYLILGIELSATASYIKKAYRKAALRHHPDKAGQFLARGENVDDELWKEITGEVHKEADRLFKMIGEAYAVLSDSAKRPQYDLEEEMRNAQKKHDGSSTSRPSNDYSYPFGRSGGMRQWPETWKSYGDQRHW